MSVSIQISLETQVQTALETFESANRKRPEVMECYLMTGDADYLLRVVVPDVQALERFTHIPGIARIRLSFALKQVKYETSLPSLRRGPRPSAKYADGRCPILVSVDTQQLSKANGSPDPGPRG